ncbi:MAG: hypothetical protein WD712_02765 [Candidatus Spechtbacterales bacterium]
MRRIATVLLFVALLVSACSSGGGQETPGPSVLIEPGVNIVTAPPATTEPTVAETPTPTATPEPTAVPTPEPVAGSCGYLEERYCGQGVQVDASIIIGASEIFSGASHALAFKLPEGTPVFSPVSGEVLGGHLVSASGRIDFVSVNNAYAFFFAGAESAGNIREGSVPVKAKELLGVLTGESVGSPVNPTENEYNLVILVP